MTAGKGSALGMIGAWVRDVVNGRVFNANYTADHFIVGSNQLDDAGGTDRDKRMFFNKTKGAFRAGEVTGTQWDNASVGNQSVALGLNNTASGIASTALGFNAVASGDQSLAVSGTASGTGSFAGCGNGSTASGAYSFAGCGSTSSADFSFSHGLSCDASGYAAEATGIAAVASRFGQWARGGGDSSSFLSQSNRFIAARISTSATPVVLYFNGLTSATLTGVNTNVLTVPVGRAHHVTLKGMARRTDTTGDYASFTSTFTITRNAAGNAAFIAAPVVTASTTAGAATWTLVPTINTGDATNNYLVLTATGEAAKTIRWAVELATLEVG